MIPNWLQRFVSPTFLFIWLRFRLRFNQVTHSSKLAQALGVLGMVFVAFATVSVWIGGLLAGFFLTRLVGVENHYLIWDGLLVIAMVAWAIHVLNEAQRGDPITFDKILHLPIAPTQAFVVNYLSSLGSTVFLMTVGGYLGFILGTVFVLGWVGILFLIPVSCFLFAMTAVTYWLQGWLAAVMANPRKRQTVLVLIPIVIIVMVQIPVQVLNWLDDRNRARVEAKTTEKDEAPAEGVKSEEANPTDAREARRLERETRRREALMRWKRAMTIANDTVPPLWPAGAVQAWTEPGHRWWLPLVTSFLLVAAGCLALRASYRSTLQYWRGEWEQGRRIGRGGDTVRSRDVGREGTTVARRIPWIERRLPWSSEEVSAVATMTWTSMWRAPEVKLYLFLPLLAPAILGMVFRKGLSGVNDYWKGLVLCGFSAFVMLVASAVSGNMFGYDRAGFRAFVLSPMDRRNLLMGRNLAYAPLVAALSLGSTLVFCVLYQVGWGMAIHTMLISLSMLAPYLLVMNWMAILTPFPMASGSVQPKHFDFGAVVLNLVLSMILPIILGVSLIPLGVQYLVGEWVPAWRGWPVGILLSVLLLITGGWLHRKVLPNQAKLLEKREKELLRIVTSKVE
ncbi:hypothetical protein VN12_08775 [Pirellula sp. SH-Sr6A]|uniref:hypothetical protein n=1 Tax=Pirellula sp. SH-Sr6A TaxID=1632865 RepID=UPI00078C0143|nr:hypothetical protein [Pirellula sp. SH-Sr6A]AMV32203.1 hypothetical protein VN12_08775 [Pirellula sp. SH-Sr6A]